MPEIITKFNIFLNDIKNLNKSVVSITGDNEFNKINFNKQLDDNNIKKYFIIASDEHIIKNSNKLGILDRFVRTFKNYMNKFLSLKNINDWVHNYDYINNIYNELPHRGLKNY